MEAAPVFASTAITSGLPPVPGAEQARQISYGHTALASTTAAVKEAAAWVYPLRQEIGRVIVGQKYLIDRLLIALIANGHILLEGVPGLAKTLALRTLAAAVQARFQRIQFTPDMLPADIVGTLIYNPRDGTFNPKLGPVFANFVLADEINRAPAKVQSALLESMQERQVTLGENTYNLPEPFLVMATQNPIEQEGTYPLPEAQVDRFMLKIVVTYPSRAEERGILDTMATTTPNLNVQPVVAPEHIIQAREVVNTIHVDDKVRDYIVDIVIATRDPKAYRLDFPGWIQYGASPRATISLTLAARALAFLNGRAYVTPQDVKEVAHDVLQHRVTLTYEAEAENLSSRDIIQKILDTLPVP
ncbi:MAG: MoxR family ATPase [Methylacidiphilales bacterium]|nr:MoxR family ATPase [Candidatus Methylacidiphilales bacterium]